jgi:hypothetical protein
VVELPVGLPPAIVLPVGPLADPAPPVRSLPGVVALQPMNAAKK